MGKVVDAIVTEMSKNQNPETVWTSKTLSDATGKSIKAVQNCLWAASKKENSPLRKHREGGVLRYALSEHAVVKQTDLLSEQFGGTKVEEQIIAPEQLTRLQVLEENFLSASSELLAYTQHLAAIVAKIKETANGC